MTESGDRSIEVTVEVPGTPEEVWRAIATGPGITSWFVPTAVDERAGGDVTHDFGEMGADTGRVIAWEPPRRLVTESGAAAGRPLAFEWLVEAAGGDTCTVRLVNSGFGPGDEFDGDFDGMSAGWRIFLENLRIHLTHFAGRPAGATAVPMAMVAGDNERAWQELCGAFGVPPDLVAGDVITLEAGPSAQWTGRIEAVIAAAGVRHYAVVLDQPRGAGFLAAEGGGDQIALSAYLSFYGEDAADAADLWRAAWASRWSADGGERAM